MASSKLRILLKAGKWFVLLLCAAAVLAGDAALADRIILKDGSVEESNHVWVSKHFVHFILKGTQTVEVRYAKEFVERIERTDSPQPEMPKSAKPQSIPDSASPITKNVPVKIKEEKQEAIAQSAPKDLNLPDEKYIRQNRKISFYDPHRPKRYWASRDSRYSSLEAALDALAQQYGRSRQWVTTHMGSENDLGEIHAHLVRQRKLELNGTPEDTNATRRTSAPPPKESKLSHQMEASPKVPAKFPAPDLPAGIKFYDPRRKHKYWTSQTARYDTLANALQALADQYGISPKWIEDHLGSTNDLSEIHSNIRKSLTLERDAMP